MENRDLENQKEPDMDTVFNMLKENMPMPDEHVKDGILNVLTYILSM